LHIAHALQACTIALNNGEYVTLLFGIDDDLKRRAHASQLTVCSMPVVDWWRTLGCPPPADEQMSLWTAPLFIAASTMQDAFAFALCICERTLPPGQPVNKLYSAQEAVNNCDYDAMIKWRKMCLQMPV
jgi:hypothetical protein